MGNALISLYIDEKTNLCFALLHYGPKICEDVGPHYTIF